MPPWKPKYDVGAVVDNLKYFVDQLFDPQNQSAFRNQFFQHKHESVVRQLLADNKVIIPPDDGNGNPVRIVIVDIQNARMWKADDFNANQLFYLLVMPPVPTYYDTEMQAWESAWYHAIVDGFGM